MSKFKIGDRVRHERLGSAGTVEDFFETPGCPSTACIYSVLFDSGAHIHGILEQELTLAPDAEPSERQTGTRLKDSVIPQDDKLRKEAPIYEGLFGYFPYALFAVAAHSAANDRKHNPTNTGGPSWARDKSKDHLSALGRHLCEVHTDPDYHLAAIAWRALAALQERGEAKGHRAGASSVISAGTAFTQEDSRLFKGRGCD